MHIGDTVMWFPISYTPLTEVILGALGLGSGKAWVDVDDPRIYARAGWAGHVEIPRSSLLSVERVDRVPGQGGYGVYGHTNGTWALTGSKAGVVRLTLSQSASGKLLFFPMRPNVIYLSLQDPDAFVSAVQPTAR